MSTIIPLAALGLIVFIILVARRKPHEQPDAAPAPARFMTADGLAARKLELRDALDRTPFGGCLASAVWDKLVTTPLGDGVIVESHREYCGHGLVHTAEGVVLSEVYDFGTPAGPALAEWTSKEEFVAFFAGRSDFSCSGWDTADPVFATSDEWSRSNQRLTRAVLERFLRQPR